MIKTVRFLSSSILFFDETGSVSWLAFPVFTGENGEVISIVGLAGVSSGKATTLPFSPVLRRTLHPSG